MKMRDILQFIFLLLIGILIIAFYLYHLSKIKDRDFLYSYTCYSGQNIIYSGTGLGLESFANGVFTTDEITKKKVWLSGTCIFTEI